jgi:hypothetical protein
MGWMTWRVNPARTYHGNSARSSHAGPSVHAERRNPQMDMADDATKESPKMLRVVPCRNVGPHLKSCHVIYIREISLVTS